MNYEKLTLDRFALNLKEGKYDTPTGARRAIGKTSSWKQTEKDQAQLMVNKHFKVDASAPAKPAAKKTAVRKVAKKAARKAAVKAVASPTPVSEEKATPKAAPIHRTPSTEKFKAPPAPVGAIDAVQMSHQLIGVVTATRAELDKAYKADPQADFAGIEKELRLVLYRGLALVNVSTEAEAGSATLPPARVSLPTPSPAPKTVKAVSTPVVAPTTDVEVKPIVPAPVNGTSHELNEEEQRVADAIRSVTPSAGIAGLPRPIIPPQGG
jgi:hypothetical protein